MHIVLGLITSILTILYLLDRLGVDIGRLNPFHWRKRRAWAKKYESDPIYSIEDPIHIAAIITLGVAKLDGDLSSATKEKAQELFEKNFSMAPKEAKQLVNSAAHLLGGPKLIDVQLKNITEKRVKGFSPDQAKSLADMMLEVSSTEKKASAEQENYIRLVQAHAEIDKNPDSTWH